MRKEDEIRILINTLGDAFSKLDFDAWLNLFHSPRTVISRGAVFSSSSHEETKNAMMPVFDKMRDRGFSHTHLDTCNIKLLNSSTAIASTVWSRIDTDGNVIERLGATYLVVAAGDNWKVAVVTTHSAEVVAIEDEN